jgi:hypothetical protein
MNKIRQWYVNNQDAITWFLIGWLTCAGIDALSRGQYISAAFCLGIAYVNYAFCRVRLT